jgi:hypothetical protein
MKIRGSYETNIDTTQGGYIRIEQPDPMGDDPMIVLLSADQLPKVIEELQALYDDRESWDYDQTEEAEEPREVPNTAKRAEELPPVVLSESPETH